MESKEILPLMENLPEIIEQYYPQFSGIHEACAATPVMDEDDYENLLSSIKESGLWEPIIRDEKTGLLLDGRNRLLCCYDNLIDIRVEDVYTDDPWQYVWDLNVARRHLTVGQKAMFADQWREDESKKAKERQQLGGQLGGQLAGNHRPLADPRVVATLPQPYPPPKVRDILAAKVGVGSKAIDKAQTIRLNAPDIAEKVKSAEITLEEGYREARQREKAKELHPGDTTKSISLNVLRETVNIVALDGQIAEINKPKLVKFNQTNDSIDWANWSWNPVTGCKHGCNFCYAREIANAERMKDVYPFKFEPAFHEYRLEAPVNTPYTETSDPRDGRVFVCSMADLFGKWVPEEWVQKVFQACQKAPYWEYLFLTKYCHRYSTMPLLEGAWYGASVIKQADVVRTERDMSKFEAPGCVKWVSLEPMLEPIKFTDISWCDLMVIGAQTSTTQPEEGFVAEFAPEFDWVFDVVKQCREQGVPYYLKENIGLTRPGMVLPKMNPRKSLG